MRFSCISAPQRKLTSWLTSILPSQTTSPPGRTASTDARNAAALPAASITASAPRPAVSCLAAAATSSRFACTPRGATQALRWCGLRLGDVEGEDLRGGGGARALHRREADRAAADDHNGIGVADMGDIERRADTGHHAAADQAGAIERDVRGNR